MKTRKKAKKERSKLLELFPDAEFLGEGRRSVVLKQGERAIKIEKASHPGTARDEARWLEEVNKHGIGPELISYNQELGYVVYRYAEGERLPDFIKRCEDPGKLAEVIEVCLRKAEKLDSLGITKEEMHRPLKHVLVGDEVKMIDFEKCHRTESPKNVTQLCQFLFIGKNKSAKKVRKTFGISRDEAIVAAKEYESEGLEPVLLLLDLDNVPKG